MIIMPIIPLLLIGLGRFLFDLIYTPLFVPAEETFTCTALPVEITSVKHSKKSNTYDIEYKTDAKPGEEVLFDLSKHIDVL